MEKVRAHIFVEGYVQGVFYRAFTRDYALQFGVTGWVKNLPDGRVEIVVEGDVDKVSALIGSCQQGPPGARVMDMDVNWEPFVGEFNIFTIKRTY